MDIAYDHIQEEVISPEEASKKEGEKKNAASLNSEFQEAYKSFSASPWGTRLGGFFNDVKKQSETYYEGARHEASAAGGEALKGFTDLRSTIVSRARSISIGQKSPTGSSVAGADKDLGEDGSSNASTKERSESEALRESEGLISRFRTEATKRLKEIEKAEDAADEALMKFGLNVRNFLRDAVTIAPPGEEKNNDGTQKILFESKDQDGKRVIHTTRFDAQLHAIHSSFDSFAKDPVSPEYEKWKGDFDVEKKTDSIALDLEKYEELRRAMENLVPEKVEYAQFWARYYFLRMVIETEEQRRRDMLKGIINPVCLLFHLLTPHSLSTPKIYTDGPSPQHQVQPSTLQRPFPGMTTRTRTPNPPPRTPPLPIPASPSKPTPQLPPFNPSPLPSQTQNLRPRPRSNLQTPSPAARRTRTLSPIAMQAMIL